MTEASMPKAIAEAVGSIMGKVRNVEKSGYNEFHRYKFAKVEDLMFQVQPAMHDVGLIITQDELGFEVMADAAICARYAFSLSHTSGVTWGPVHQTGMATLKNTKGGYDDKALNKCHTAARKYFILGLFQIPAGDLPEVDAEEDRPLAANAQTNSAPAPDKSLAKRADNFAQALRSAKTPASFDAAWKKGEILRGELEKADPKRLAEINKIASNWHKPIGSEINIPVMRMLTTEAA